MANARMVALIHKDSRKRDPVDAETLARLGQVDPKLLAPVRHRSKELETATPRRQTQTSHFCPGDVLYHPPPQPGFFHSYGGHPQGPNTTFPD